MKYMKVISIDIGIKNMAYCILSLRPTGISIDHWAVLDLTTTTPQEEKHTCSCQLKNKHICNKKATFMKSSLYFCNKHARESQWLIEIPAFKKMKMEELRNYASTIIQNVSSFKRPELEKEIATYIENNRLFPVKPMKKKSANDEDLISIAKQMTEQFNGIPEIDSVHTWIIENQMTAFQPKFGKDGSTGSVRMKVIQGFVAQYGIMKGNQNHVEFVSPKNKLKGLATNIEGTDKEIYKKHKSDSVEIVHQFLQANESRTHQTAVLSTYEKKDDICDTLLQGISWLRKNNYIDYDEHFVITRIH
jgi:hypothetical protein